MDMSGYIFPTCEGSVWTKGLTKRELFAAMAMQGYIAHGEGEDCRLVTWSVRDADALLAELEKGEK